MFSKIWYQLGDFLIVKDENGKVIGRFVEKYDVCTEPNIRSKIVSRFTFPDGLPRVVVATTASLEWELIVQMYAM